MNIVLLASRGNEEVNSKFPPNLLLEWQGKLLLEHILERINFIGEFKIIFVIDSQDLVNFKMDKVIRISTNHSTSIAVASSVTRGALCSFMLAIDYLNLDDELLILNCNELLNIDFQEMVDKFHSVNADAGTVIFDSIKPLYSYVKLDNHMNVLHASEKNPISRNATAGFYWYKSTKNFLECAEDSILKNDAFNGNFYVCPVFNQLILRSQKVHAIKISNSLYMPIKSNFHKERLILEVENIYEKKQS